MKVVKERPLIYICPKCGGDMFWEWKMERMGSMVYAGREKELVCLQCGKRE